MNNMNQLKEDRKQQAKEKQVIKLKSQAKTIEEMQWRRDTSNPIINTFIEDTVDVGGWIVLDNVKMKVRMPLRKLMKELERYSNAYDNKKDELNLSQEELTHFNSVQEQVLADMIPEFDDDSDEYRVDTTTYSNVIAFCWEFYRFFGQKSSVALQEQL